ncbi:hypothetical protein ES703_110737 [subsurface metagenome]
MKEMTATWMERAGDVRDIQNVIEAEYHIVTEEPPKIGEKASDQAQATKPASTPAAEEKSQDEAIEGEGFSIDPTWLDESKKALKWTDDTCKSFLVGKYKVSTTGTLTDVIKRLTREQAEDFVKEINGRREKQASLL